MKSGGSGLLWPDCQLVAAKNLNACRDGESMTNQIVPGMREEVAREHSLGEEEKLQRVGDVAQEETVPANAQRRLARRKPVETAIGVGGTTLVHEPAEIGSREPLCGDAEVHELTLRDTLTMGEDAEPCPKCTSFLEARHRMEKEIDQEQAVTDGGTQARGTRPAATLETSVPGVTEPVELQPWQLAAVVGGVAVAGGIAGALIAGT